MRSGPLRVPTLRRSASCRGWLRCPCGCGACERACSSLAPSSAPASWTAPMLPQLHRRDAVPHVMATLRSEEPSRRLASPAGARGNGGAADNSRVRGRDRCRTLYRQTCRLYVCPVRPDPPGGTAYPWGGRSHGTSSRSDDREQDRDRRREVPLVPAVLELGGLTARLTRTTRYRPTHRESTTHLA